MRAIGSSSSGQQLRGGLSALLLGPATCSSKHAAAASRQRAVKQLHTASSRDGAAGVSLASADSQDVSSSSQSSSPIAQVLLQEQPPQQQEQQATTPALPPPPPEQRQPFGASIADLRQLLQAGVDDSQAEAAVAVIRRLNGALLQKKQRRAHKQQQQNGGAAARAPASTSSSSNRSAATATDSASPSLTLLPRALASALGSSLSGGLGCEPADVAARLAAFGANSLAAAATSSFWALLLEAASDSTLLLLMAAGGVSLALAASTGKEAADFIDGAAILASVVICVTVTAVTNYQKEAKFRQLNSLKENIPVRVMRRGVEATVSCFDLLVGDVMLVEAGDILPADGLLFAGGQIKVDESHLTGESDDVTKEPPSDGSSTGSSSASLSSCLLFSGSKVLEGFGKLLVLAVGPNSQQGMIQQMVMGGVADASKPPPQQQGVSSSSPAAAAAAASNSMLREATPLMARLEDVAGTIGSVGLAAAAAVLAVNSGLFTAELLSRGLSPWDSTSLESYLGFFITSMTLLVVAVPEGLPLAVTLSLAFSVQRMLADNNLVRNLASCETMAAATAICSDKTGTLTENNMAVVKLMVGGATFTVRPSTNAAAGSSIVSGPAAAVAATAAAAAAGGSARNTTMPRSTSSIAPDSPAPPASSGSDGTGDKAAAAGVWQDNGASSSSSAPASTAASMDGSRWRQGSGSSMSTNGSSSPVPAFAADRLTMVSLSLDSDLLDEQQAAAAVEASSSRQQQLQPGPGLSSSSDSSSEAAAEALLLSATASTLGDLRLPGQLSPTVRRLLADSISLNSTASIRLAAADDPGRAPAAAADTSDGGSDSGSEGAVAAVAPAAVVGSSSSSSSGSRQLDRSGNRTECALLEFGGRLEGRLLPGSGSSEQAAAVLQVFPFSSTRKRMSSLVALGPPLPGLHGGGAAADGGPGSGQQQPARLYVKGAAELLLDSCRLQVAPDGSLVPLPHEQIQALKARCGRGGLRVLALAYKDLLLPAAGSSSSGSSGSGAAGQQQQHGGEVQRWQLLDGDEAQQQDLVLVGLLALEDPVRAEVPGAIADCQRAGIAVRIITGDNAATATAIAASCGVLSPELASAVEDARAAAAAGSSSSSGSSQQQHQTAALRQLLAGMPTPGASSSSSADSTSSWLDGWLHGFAGSGAWQADPDAGAALVNSVDPDPRLAVLDGPTFRALVLRPDGSTDLDAFLRLWPHLRVMARCTPADKFTLVQAVKALRARGQLMETIAVTGDGTNDAPALNAADCGFAMASGTSIAKDASDILLLDNNFRSIVSAVKWGRNVYSSVTKFLQFQLTANVVALVTAAGGALVLKASPLSPVQMLWVNLIMDSLASLALATEAPTDSMLAEPPRLRDGPIITPTVAKSILGQAGLQLTVMAALLGPLGQALLTHGPAAAAAAAAATAGGDAAGVTSEAAVAAASAGVGVGAAAAAAAVSVAGDIAAAAGGGGFIEVGGLLGSPDRLEQCTLVFNAFVLMQLFNQVNSRKIHDEPDVLEGLASQKLFLAILGLEAGLQAAIVQAGGRAFSTVPLTATQWAVCVGFGGLTLLLRQALRLLPTEPPSSSSTSS